MSEVVNIIKKGVRTIQRSFIGNSWEKSVFNLKNEYPEEIRHMPNGVRLHLIGIDVAPGTFQFLLDRYDILRTLYHEKNASFYIQSHLFFIEFDGIKLNPTTAEELFIIEEIFIKGVYNFQLKGKSVVVDIGFNVGNASLFFASMSDIEAVYAFEPFVPTYRQALANLKLNNVLADKIIASNVGLSDREQSLSVDYYYDLKGQVGIHGTNLIRSEIKQTRQQEIIKLNDAAKELQEIADRHQDNNLILKIDCEGAEYDIIKRLSEKDVLSCFSVIFIEWHEHGPLSLVADLKKNGFTCFYQNTSKKVGMIYASK